MADFGTNLKNIWMKGMEAIGNTASSIASNTKYKVDEMNLLNRRREILSDFGSKAYALWQKGSCDFFPEELKKDLEELTRLDNQLVDMRAEHYSGEEAKSEAEAPAAPGETAEDEKTADEDAQETEAKAIPVIEVEAKGEEKKEDPELKTAEDAGPSAVLNEMTEKANSISDAIDDLFDQVPSVDSMAEKMNDALDQMGSNLKKFSDEMDKQLNDLNDQLTGSDQKPPEQDQ